MRTAIVAALAVALGATFVPPDPGAAVAAEEDALPWLDTTLSVQERVQSLLDASSLHQKYRWLNEQAANTPQQTEFGDVTYPAQVEGTPVVVYTDGPDGVRFTTGVTAFPAPIAFASAWDLELNGEKSAAQAAEAFDKGKNGVLGPGLASGRTPLSGRTPEYFGEDPLLTGLLTASAVTGLQSVDGKPVIADIKHYVGNEQEIDRQTSSSNVDERTLRQVYELPVEIAVAESDAASVMCSYNQINGVYACENPILTTNLKEDIGFAGYVVSDFGAVHSTAEALNAGLDQELNRPKYFTPELLDAALAAGEITEERIDEAATRVVTAYMENGLFDVALPESPVEDASTPEHKALALEAAQQGTVLLKNDGVLPLDAGAGATIAVIGATASSTPTNGVSATTICSMAWQDGNTMECEDIVSAEDAIRERAEQDGARVVFHPGDDLVAAAAVASSADIAIVFGYQKMGEFADVEDLSLQGGGDALIEAVSAANPHTVVALNTGSAVEMPWLDGVSAVLEGWYAGEQMGPALASLLWGDVNPSGKLPMTFPRSLADTPTAQSPEQYPGVFSDGSTTRAAAEEIRQVEYAEGLGVGYKWYEEQGIDPLFAFGHGLSYTTFAYADLRVSVGPEGRVDVSFSVQNTGNVTGTEIPQVYLELPDSAGEPGKRLVGFERIELAAGATERVELSIDAADSNRPFSVWDADADLWSVVSGEYAVQVGTASDDVLLQDAFAYGDADEAPAVSISANPASPDGASGWYVSALEVAVTAADDNDLAAAVEVNLDGAGWAPYEGALSISEDGEHSVSARATDASGKVSDVATWTGRLDGTAPTVSAAAETSGVVLSAADEGSGVAEVQWAPLAVEGAQPDAWQRYEEALALDDGARIAFRAIDVAGNVSADAEFVVAVPVEPAEPVPAPRITVAPGTVAPGEEVRVTGENLPAGAYTLVLRSDPVTVASPSVGADGALSVSFPVPSDTAAGAHRVQAVAADGTVIAETELRVEDRDALAVTGGEPPVLAVLGAVLLLLAGGALVAIRRTRASRDS